MSRLKNIIIAIDDSRIASTIEILLAAEQSGYRALVSPSAEQFLEVLKRRAFDCIIITESFREIRAAPLIHLIRSGAICNPGLPVVVMRAGQTQTRSSMSADSFVIDHPINDVEGVTNAIDAAIADRPRPRMILIDDKQDYLDDLMHDLGRAYEVSAATNVQDALTLFKSAPADIIVTDFNMPIADGGDLTRAIREIDRDVPILMLTIYDTPENHIKTVASGISRFLSKKASMLDIERACRELLLERELDDARSDLEHQRTDAARLVMAVSNARAEIASGDTPMADHRLKSIVAKMTPVVSGNF